MINEFITLRYNVLGMLARAEILQQRVKFRSSLELKLTIMVDGFKGEGNTLNNGISYRFLGRNENSINLYSHNLEHID